MLTRKTQYAWMAVGGLICLIGLALACKLRDGNRAIAQLDPPAPAPAPSKKDPSPSIFTLPPTMPARGAELLPPPRKSEKSKEPSTKDRPSKPKATLQMPMPSDPMPLSGPMPMPSAPKFPPPPMPTASKPETLPPPTLITPTSFPSSPAPMAMGKQQADKPAPPSPPLPGLQPISPPASRPPATITVVPPKKDSPDNPRWNAPSTVMPASAVPAPMHESARMQPGEPPLAPAPGPVQIYRARGSETLHDIARRTLGSSERWTDLHKLNPTLRPDQPLRSGATVRLPADACIQADDAEPVKALPVLRTKPPAPKAKALPLTGTYQCSLDDKGRLTLPRAIRDQLDSSDTVLLSPGPDKCLWLTNQPHLERLGERLDQSQANEADVRVFKRLYFAQTEKLSVNSEGRVTIPERLGQFAGLHQEVVLVGIDDHFEVWDAAHWRKYTQQRNADHSAAMAEQE